MAMIVEHYQPTFKYFCRICKKGFGCGRALGGHMRAHGIRDENMHLDDGDAVSDWEDKNGSQGNKRMYALRTNPNRLKSCRACENCGKEFLSWKSFLEHGKCTPDNFFDDFPGGEMTSPGSKEDDGNYNGKCGWSKGKRSKRAKVDNSNSNSPSVEEEELANCLVMLSAARVEPEPMVTKTDQESCASANREDDRKYSMSLMLASSFNQVYEEKGKSHVSKGMFECKACKKVFSSHQALGGHRASHKKVKECFASRLDKLNDSVIEGEEVITHDNSFITSKPKSKSVIDLLPLDHATNLQLATTPFKRNSKVHECSICHRIFSSGQALGGHKRCHWITSNSSDTSSVPKFHQFKDQIPQFLQQNRPKYKKHEPKPEPLDLNSLPTSSFNDTSRIHQQGQTDNLLSLEISTAICLQPWTSHGRTSNNDINNVAANTNASGTIKADNDHDDEADSKVKMAKLSDLKDMNTGNSSPWLQVGIGSTINVDHDP